MHEDDTTTYTIARFVALCGWLTVLVGGGVLAFGLYGFSQTGFGTQQAAVAGSLIGLSVAGFGLLLILWGQLTRAVTHTATNTAELVKLLSKTGRSGTAGQA
jgi:hypothetical protein